ncbi:response regulator transcription factor [Nitrospiraceae bacterium HYJII51-Mn-bac16s-1-B09]|uniref:Response regulator transcription factor n=1 Tax=Candidatus Manganitrophus noduliformans TaxID=2606439 RepID=A0A7X6I9F8_9BACT|nr:response regulator transcription factor [Candidatus Manganitrophus noduliformans]
MPRHEVRLKKIKVLIVEEYEGIIQVFRRLLRTAPEIEIVWEARSEAEAIMALEMFKPDIILVNFASSGRQATKIWKEFKTQAPESRLLALTIPENPTLVRQAKTLGVTFLAKEEMVRTLVPTIRALIESSMEKCSP